MGKATILQSLGEGLYSASVDYGSEERDRRVTELQAQLDAYNLQLPDMQSAVLSARLDLNSAVAILNARIDLLIAATPENKSERETAVKEATTEVAEKGLAFDRVEAPYNELVGLIASTEKKISTLSALTMTQTRQLWCVDYTEDATGEVATIEIPGEPQSIVIAPGAAAVTSADGVLLAREIQESTQVYYNAAILPGWQKYMPTYRVGEITSLTGDICTVSLDDARSTAQNLSINQQSGFSDVPIEYMDCNGDVFDEGDRVVVDITDGWDSPRVIGFESNPRECGYPWNVRGMYNGYVYFDTQKTGRWSSVYTSAAVWEYRVNKGSWVSIPYYGFLAGPSDHYWAELLPVDRKVDIHVSPSVTHGWLGGVAIEDTVYIRMIWGTIQQTDIVEVRGKVAGVERMRIAFKYLDSEAAGAVYVAHPYMGAVDVLDYEFD